MHCSNLAERYWSTFQTLVDQLFYDVLDPQWVKIEHADYRLMGKVHPDGIVVVYYCNSHHDPLYPICLYEHLPDIKRELTSRFHCRKHKAHPSSDDHHFATLLHKTLSGMNEGDEISINIL